VKCSLVRETDVFDALGPEWNRLLENSASNVPFLRHEFQRAWWDSLGGGEWNEGELWLASGRDADGVLRGIAPLFAARTGSGQISLLFIGTLAISDYLDLIAAPADLPVFAEALLSELQAHGPQGWEMLDLHNIPEESPTIPALEAAAGRRGWLVTSERLEPCPVLHFEGDWESYLGSLDKKQRHELRRKMRRIEEVPEGVSWRIIGPGDDIEAATETFMGLMAYDEKKARFLTQVMRSHMRRAVRAAFDHGWLQLSFLDIGGTPAAGYLNFDYAGRLWVYNSGLNPDYLQLSPGWVLSGHIIRWAIEHDRHEMDFLRGDERYKYQLGGKDRYIRRLRIERRR
jgi:CelD/BcsL family acetyltransferase involved in cellulose biosynthesis